MAKGRLGYSEAEQVALNTQVGGRCPLCDVALFYSKSGRTHKAYELAHIYPLNAKPTEVTELQGVAHLHADVNHLDNIIPLCASCHSKFDKPRTKDEYEVLFELKKSLIEREKLNELASQYPLEEQIAAIVSRLHSVVLDDSVDVKLEFDPKRLDDKFSNELPALTRRKIKNAVSDYYTHVRAAFLELERTDAASSTLIFAQVRAFYLKQVQAGLPQSVVFQGVVEWIRKAADAETVEGAEIVASFFIQDCEVFA